MATLKFSVLRFLKKSSKKWTRKERARSRAGGPASNYHNKMFLCTHLLVSVFLLTISSSLSFIAGQASTKSCPKFSTNESSKAKSKSFSSIERDPLFLSAWFKQVPASGVNQQLTYSRSFALNTMHWSATIVWLINRWLLIHHSSANLFF